MKAGTETKLKFKALKRKLGLSLWQITGLLESLWRATEHNSPAGDIGKLTNDEIASAIEWEGDANDLISALVEFRWLDPDTDFRLVVHDWSDHAPNYLKGAFAKHGKVFADQYAKQRAKQDETSGKIVPSNVLGHGATNPILSYPIQNLSNPPPPGGVGGKAAAAKVSWAREEKQAIIAELTERGLDRAIAAANEAERNGFTPEAMRDLLFEYDENRSKFHSPGAITDRIKKGAWPAPGVLNGEQVAVKADSKSKRARDDEMGAVLYRTVNDCRKVEHLDDTAIKARLRQVLPVDFLEKEGWA